MSAPPSATWPVAEGRRHVVADLAYGPGRFTLCTCGRRFEARTDDTLAVEFNRHARDLNYPSR